MITIMGASGKTGRAAAEALLKQDEKVRVIARAKDHLKTHAPDAFRCERLS